MYAYMHLFKWKEALQVNERLSNHSSVQFRSLDAHLPTPPKASLLWVDFFPVYPLDFYKHVFESKNHAVYYCFLFLNTQLNPSEKKKTTQNIVTIWFCNCIPWLTPRRIETWDLHGCSHANVQHSMIHITQRWNIIQGSSNIWMGK